MTDFDPDALPKPVSGAQLMNALSGKSELTYAEMDDWMKGTRKIREASRPNTGRPRTTEHGDTDD